MFPPIQCSKSSYFTQWLISEYLSRINNETQQSNQTPLKSGASPSSPPPPQHATATTTSPPTSSSQQQHHPPSSSSSSSFSAKNLKHLFTHHHHHHHNNHQSNHHHHSKETSKVKNNNEYKNGVSSSTSSSSPHQQVQSPDSISSPKNIEFIQLLALNALEFTAPIYSFINKQKQEETGKQGSSSSSSSAGVTREQLATTSDLVVAGSDGTTSTCKCPSTRTFVQLSGHPGSFATAGPNTIWKKMPEDEGGAACGRQQVGSGIGMDGSLRELLQALGNTTTSATPSGCDHPHQNQTQAQQTLHSKTQSLLSTATPLTSPNSPSTIPITVFFNSSNNNNNNNNKRASVTSSSGGSSSSNASQAAAANLLHPQIYQIPTQLLPNETQVYRKVTSSKDPITTVIPKYITETCYNSQMFLELEDLLTNFSQPNPTIMDVKLGTRTFMESEVSNCKPRPDLYKKLIAVDPSACTEEEHRDQAVTKLTYMLFREKQSSSNSLGFRVEGVKIGDRGQYKPELQLSANFKQLRDEAEICSIFRAFCKNNLRLIRDFQKRLIYIRDTLESSPFFMTHEVIGSSLLFIHDDVHTGVWLIDFAKTFEVKDTRVTHRGKWIMGNREDGVLTGIDNIIRLFQGLGPGT